MPEILKFFNITKGGRAEFTFSDDNGNITKLKLSPEIIPHQDVVNINDEIKKKPISMSGDSKSEYSDLYWYKYIPQDKIMYFQYNNCIDRNTGKEIGIKDCEKFPEFDKFEDGLITQLNEKEINKFIIDLRDNTGGDSRLMTDFASRLSNIKKLNQNGKIFIITGRKTFSSAVFACISLKDSTQAISFGEPTGGNVNGYGNVGLIILPNSKINISCSTKYFNLSPKYKDSFTPDVEIEQSYDDYVNGIDDAYEAIKNYKG